MDLNDLYRERAELVHELIRRRYAGKSTEFAEATGIAETTVSRWFMKKKGRRNIGEAVAAKIEARLSLPRGSIVMPGGGPWPFDDVDRRRFDILAPTQRAKVEERVKAMVEHFEEEHLTVVARTAKRLPPP